MADIFPAAVYLLCFMTSVVCAVLLARSFRQARARMLFWSALCFALLAVNNLVVIVDLLLLPGTDLRLWRLLLSSAAIGTILFGFIWDLED